MKQEGSFSVIVKVAETEAERQAAFDLRERVFLGEMRRDRTVETDEYDQMATHVIALAAGSVVGTLRLYTVVDPSKSVKIGRVAVDREYRHRGIATEMMQFAHRWAVEHGFVDCYLHAQVAVRPFYEALGYRAEGDEFLEAGTEHILMRR